MVKVPGQNKSAERIVALEADATLKVYKKLNIKSKLSHHFLHRQEYLFASDLLFRDFLLRLVK